MFYGRNTLFFDTFGCTQQRKRNCCLGHRALVNFVLGDLDKLTPFFTEDALLFVSNLKLYVTDIQEVLINDAKY